MKRILILLFGLILSVPHLSWSAGKSPEFEKPEYQDTDGDGVNDLFRDADGDGVNDVTGKPYRHNYTFNDANGDGINDSFIDADGDGINDLMSNEQYEGKVKSYYAIDFDSDGINDVTGKYYQFRARQNGFLDENADGIRDTHEGSENPPGQEQKDLSNNDTFEDEDGDGINDGRGFGRGQRNRGAQGFNRERRSERNP
ncbi:MAG: hypothetical protein JXB48_00125 [Candidatus Latescibacteria bacterium]|nr:hypothetical protein [Candidatus Latescibacterota bacterium]